VRQVCLGPDLAPETQKAFHLEKTCCSIKVAIDNDGQTDKATKLEVNLAALPNRAMVTSAFDEKYRGSFHLG
jgi:hypothetical protein